MPPVIDQAYVEILPETRRFAAQTRAGVDRGMKQVTSSVDRHVRDANGRFVKLGTHADRTFKIIGQSGERAGKTVSSAFSASARSARGSFGSVASVLRTGLSVGGITAITAGFAGAFVEAEQAARITRVFNNQIKNLGASGKAAFAEASRFADEFGASIGRDDDDVRAVQTKLASFPEAFRKGALGAEAMRRATQAAFDLEAIGIGSAESNIIGIGKALNDPIKGINALARSGVSFSAEQKNQIKNYVKQGQLAKAQSVLLAGIETNAKGAAEAAASPLSRIRAVLSNIAEGIAGKLTPAINFIATFTVSTLLPLGGRIAAVFSPIFREIIGGVKAFVAAFRAGGNEITSSGFAGFLERLGLVARATFNEVRGGVRALVAAFRDGGNEVTSTGLAGFLERVGIVARNVFDWLRVNVPLGMGYVNAALMNVRNALAVVIPVVLNLAQLAFPVLIAVVKAAVAVLSAIANFIRSNSTLVVSFATAIGVLVAAWKIYSVVQWFATGSAKAWFVQAKLVMAATRAWAVVQSMFNVVMTANPIGLVVVALVALAAAVFVAYKRSETFRNVVQTAFRAVSLAAAGLWNFYIKPYFNLIKNAISGAFTSAKWAWDNVLRPTFNGVKTAVGAVKKAFDVAVAGIKIAWNKLHGIVRNPVNLVIGIYNEGIVRIWNWLASKVGLGQLSTIKKFATGGVATGPGGRDQIPAMLTRGEGVLSEPEMRKIGGPAGFEALREGISRFTRGGIVGVDGTQHLSLGGVVGGLIDQAQGAVRGALARVVEEMLGPVRGAINAIPASGFGQLVRGLPLNLLTKLVQWVRGDDTKFVNTMAPLNIGTATAPGGAPAANQAIGKAVLARYGWGQYWSAFNSLVMGESGWRNTAQNPTSTAYGIGQFLNSTWATVGGTKTSDPALQVKYMLDYIRSVYGDPGNAYRTWSGRSPHWYDAGGLLPTGASIAVNNTGRPETVRTYDQERALRTGSTYFAPGAIVVNGGASGGAQLGDLVRRAVVDALVERDRAAMRGRRR